MNDYLSPEICTTVLCCKVTLCGKLIRDFKHCLVFCPAFKADAGGKVEGPLLELSQQKFHRMEN